MAYHQKIRCKLERKGVREARKVIGTNKRQNFLAPFDLVTLDKGYEVKTMNGLAKDLKIHIADSSLKRKLDYATKYNLIPVLLAIVVYPDKIEVYQSRLVQSIRVSQMERVN
jgi:hypothetical protein